MNKDNPRKMAPSMHVCLHCGEKVRLSYKDRTKAARPKCFKCGSSALEPVVKEEKEQ